MTQNQGQPTHLSGSLTVPLRPHMMAESLLTCAPLPGTSGVGLCDTFKCGGSLSPFAEFFDFPLPHRTEACFSFCIEPNIFQHLPFGPIRDSPKPAVLILYPRCLGTAV